MIVHGKHPVQACQHLNRIGEIGPRQSALAEHVTAAIGLFGFALAPLFTSGIHGAIIMMTVGLTLMGLSYGPLGTIISELFPTPVRYTGSSLAFSTAGILGASLTPYIATWLAKTYGLPFVGYYVTLSAILTTVGLLLIRETKDQSL